VADHPIIFAISDQNGKTLGLASPSPGRVSGPCVAPPDQGLIHRPTKTEVTAVVARSLVPTRAVVARTNWRGCLEQNTVSDAYANCR
jgi:hypothetical protein